jgi:hypothetical protein
MLPLDVIESRVNVSLKYLRFKENIQLWGKSICVLFFKKIDVKLGPCISCENICTKQTLK